MKKESQELIYIDKEGRYGDATGMYIFKASDLGENDIKEFNRRKDTAESMIDLVLRLRDKNNSPSTLHIINKSGYVFHPSLLTNSEAIIDKMAGADTTANLLAE